LKSIGFYIRYLNLNGLDNLEHLTLSNVKAVQTEPFNNLTNLRQLTLVDWLEESSTSPNLFENLSNLVELKLERATRVADYSKEFANFKFTQGLINLKSLNLSGNKIKALIAFQFVALKNLIYLNLSSNPIETIESNSFAGLESLQHLSLENVTDGNQSLGFLKSIKEDSLDGLINLKRLDLGSNYISGKNVLLQLVSKKCPNLVDLGLRGNQVSLDERTLRLFVNLEILDLSENCLKKLGRNVFASLGKLERLNLSHNELKGFDKEDLNGLIGLKELRLYGNHLASLDNVLGKLKKLEKIGLPPEMVSNEVLKILERSNIRFIAEKTSFYSI
jgi:Leucine-rich repeat (LRR) protein